MESKTNIVQLLASSVQQFNTLILELNETDFEKNIHQKWSAGQDLAHLIKVLSIVNIAFMIPKPILQLLYGKNKATSKSIEALKTIYKNALANGAQSPSIYIPKPINYKDKAKLLEKHVKLNTQFIKKINALSENKLDTYKLPHPILGKITLRELAIFTGFHTLHHFELLQEKLKK